jgi:membrane associated rhomboid family serine protease
MLLAFLFAGLIFVDSIGPDANVFAHLFGVGVGLLLGYFFTSRNRRRSGDDERL